MEKKYIKTLPSFAAWYREELPEYHFFDKSTMKFFDTKWTNLFYNINGKYAVFVIADKRCFDDYNREYKLKLFDFDNKKFVFVDEETFTLKFYDFEDAKMQYKTIYKGLKNGTLQIEDNHLISLL